MDMTPFIYELCEQLPESEKFVLSYQIRKSIISVSSNIAEGAGRNSPNEFKQFLHIANGSLFELETQLLICEKLNYFNNNQSDFIFQEINELKRMITSLIKSIR